MHVKQRASCIFSSKDLLPRVAGWGPHFSRARHPIISKYLRRGWVNRAGIVGVSFQTLQSRGYHVFVRRRNAYLKSTGKQGNMLVNSTILKTEHSSQK